MAASVMSPKGGEGVRFGCIVTRPSRCWSSQWRKHRAVSIKSRLQRVSYVQMRLSNVPLQGCSRLGVRHLRIDEVELGLPELTRPLHFRLISCRASNRPPWFVSECVCVRALPQICYCIRSTRACFIESWSHYARLRVAVL